MSTSGSSFNIPIAKPCFAGNETELIAEVMKTGWICQGPMVARFEQDVAKYTQAKFAVAASSCTTALHLAMLVHGIGPGDDVICPSYSMIATANSITYAGATAQFVDIDPNTLNIDANTTAEYIKEHYSSDLRNSNSGNKLKAILLVHQIGIPADIDAFQQLCKKHNLVLIEDAACAIGSQYKGKPIGASGNSCTLSFHPRKVISCGEGGMLLTNDESIAEKTKVLRAHGMSLSDHARHKAGCTTFETYDVVGYNYRMTDLQAAIGIKQMELLDSFVQKRIAVAERYNREFANLDNVELIKPPAYATLWNYQSYPIRLKHGGTAERNAVMEALERAGVASRRGIPPIHKESIYDRGITLPNTESVSARSMFLPMFPQLTDAEVEHIIASVKEAVSIKATARK